MGLLGPLGAVGVAAAVLVAADRSGADPLTGGYLSDLGASGGPGAGAFRVGLVAAALACLGVAVALASRVRWRDPRVVLLVVAAVDLAAQTVVRCDGPCRLPVADGAVPSADLGHFVVAAAGFALWVGVTALDVVDPQPVALRASMAATTSYAVHLTLLGTLLLVDPYGEPAALLQRTLVLTGLAWTAGVGVVLATRPSTSPD